SDRYIRTPGPDLWGGPEELAPDPTGGEFAAGRFASRHPEYEATLPGRVEPGPPTGSCLLSTSLARPTPPAAATGRPARRTRLAPVPHPGSGSRPRPGELAPAGSADGHSLPSPRPPAAGVCRTGTWARELSSRGGGRRGLAVLTHAPIPDGSPAELRGRADVLGPRRVPRCLNPNHPPAHPTPRPIIGPTPAHPIRTPMSCSWWSKSWTDWR